MKYLFAAGGTGGHINPALAVAGEIRATQPDARILFVGTENKMESRLVPAAGFDFTTIKISGFQRKISLVNLFKNIKTLFYLATSAFKVRKIIRKFDPDVIVGFGGYVSGPVLMQGAKMGYKTAIHEQNAYPGVTNKALAKSVDRVMITVENARDKLQCKNEAILTGLPVRGEMITADREKCREELGLKPEDILVLSMGGSLGAEAINKAMTDVILDLKDTPNLKFIHAMGQYGLWVKDEMEKNGVTPETYPNIDLREYINDMHICMPAADIVVCRAGASSLSEIEVLGKASVLIPSPNVAENHQYHNAMALVENNAALMIEEKDLTGEALCEKIKELAFNSELRQQIETNAKAIAVVNSKEKIAGIVTDLARKGS